MVAKIKFYESSILPLSKSSTLLFEQIFVLNFMLPAFKGIMRWQGRVWKLVGNLISGATSSKGDDCDAATLAEWEDRLYDARNQAVKEASSCVIFHCWVDLV